MYPDSNKRTPTSINISSGIFANRGQRKTMKTNGSFEDAISGEPILAASSGSWDQNDVLMLLRQDSSQSEDSHLNSPKKNQGLLKGKFKAAIKSLQCSPRVEGDSHGKQKGKHNNHKKNNNMLPPTSMTIEPLNDIPQQPVFIANFDEFETMNKIANAPVHVETGSVSSALELEKVLNRLDSRDASKNDIILNHDNLEIFTNNTNDTDDTHDNNNNNNNDEDKKSDVIQDLWNVSDPPLQFDDQNEQDHVNPTQINANAFPLSEWESPPSPKPLIHKEHSHYSQDSNDTPRTCNKSLILTPKNQERPSIESSSENNEDLFGKPPKELFHRSLSLGDSLSPTEDDSPCRSSGNSSGESHPSLQQQQQTQQYKYQSLDTLNLPAMNARRHSSDKNKNLMVQNTEKTNSRRHSSDKKNLMVQPMENDKPTTPDRSNSNSPQSEGSPLSSTISSFVFSTADGNQAKQQHRRRVVSPEATSPGFFWKTHPKGDDQRQPPAPQRSKPEIPTSPSFFWKTHPRITIKSYHYQNVPVRRVNSKLGTGLHLAEVATS